MSELFTSHPVYASTNRGLMYDQDDAALVAISMHDLIDDPVAFPDNNATYMHFMQCTGHTWRNAFVAFDSSFDFVPDKFQLFARVKSIGGGGAFYFGLADALLQGGEFLEYSAAHIYVDPVPAGWNDYQSNEFSLSPGDRRGMFQGLTHFFIQTMGVGDNPDNPGHKAPNIDPVTGDPCVTQAFMVVQGHYGSTKKSTVAIPYTATAEDGRT